MQLVGHVVQGHIVLDEPANLPEGAQVRIEVLPATPAPPEGSTLLDRMKPFMGILDDLPEDGSIQHDHYLYGTPKKA